jgi:hypothetical protein
MDHIKRCAEMAKMAEIAYLDGKEAKEKFKEEGFPNHKFWDIDGAQVHAVWVNETPKAKGVYVLAFRGTEPDELSDVLADLNAFPDKGVSGGWVHNGFQNELEKVWEEIKAHKASHKDDCYFYITGHSLGGAMATLAASRFNLIDRVDCLFTYGSPRVGTRGFVKSCKFLHYRHKNNNDLVTTVPLFLMGYKHHGILRYINFYGNVRKLTTWQMIKDKWRGWKSGILDGMMDHGIGNYCKALKGGDK